jgi:hypothetical protein
MQAHRSKAFRWYHAVFCAFLFVIGFLLGSKPPQSNIKPESSQARTKLSEKQTPPPQQKMLDRMAQLVAMQRQSLFDQGVLYPDVDNTFTSFNDCWQISDTLAKRLNLSEEQRESAQKSITRFGKRLEDLVHQNTERTSSSTSGAAGENSYRIRPFIKEGHAELASLDHELKQILPLAVAEELFKYVRWRPVLGAYGANEVELSFCSGSQNGACHLTRRNSMTGDIISSCEYSEKELREYDGFKKSIFMERTR